MGNTTFSPPILVGGWGDPYPSEKCLRFAHPHGVIKNALDPPRAPNTCASQPVVPGVQILQHALSRKRRVERSHQLRYLLGRSDGCY